MPLDVRSVSDQAEHPRQFDRLPGDRRRLPPGHREPRLAEKRRRAGGRPRYLNAACRSACPDRGVRGGAGLRPHQPGADPVPTILLREERNGAGSAAPVPRTAAARCRRTRPGPCSPRRQAHGPCPPRDPAIVPLLRKCAIGRSTFLTCAGPAGSSSFPDAGKPVAAARMTLTATAGRVIPLTNAASSRTSPRPRRPRPSGCAGMMPAIPRPLAVRAIGLSAAGPAGGTAAELRRPGCRRPGLRSGGHRRRPRRGPGKAGELRLVEWEVAVPQ